MDLNRVVGTVDLKDKIEEHCQSGIRTSETERTRILFGCHNTQRAQSIILKTFAQHEKEVRQGITGRHLLAELVAIATDDDTREFFSRTEVSAIVDNAGRVGLNKNSIDTTLLPYARATSYIGYDPTLTVFNLKRSIVFLAKAVLWLEAYSFLLEYGHQFDESLPITD